MAGSSPYGNLARAAKVIALLLFLLPWVTISCSSDALTREAAPVTQTSPMMSGGIPIARANGLQLATGAIKLVTDGMPQRDNAAPPPDFQPEIGVIAGAALIVLALIATFLLKGAAGAIAGIGGSALAIAALCYSIFLHVPQAARDAFASSGSASGGGSGPSPEQLAQIIQVKVEFGFYLTLVMLILAIVFNVMAIRKPAIAGVPVATPPPAG